MARPKLWLAGAGSGKTSTLAHRVAHLIVQGAGQTLAPLPLSARQRLGLLQRMLAGEDVRPQPTVRQIIEIKELGFPAVRKADLVAAGLRHSFVFQDAERSVITAS